MALLKEKGRNSRPVATRLPDWLAFRMNDLAKMNGRALSGILAEVITKQYDLWESAHTTEQTRKRLDAMQHAREAKKRLDVLVRMGEREAGNAGEQPARGSSSDRSVDGPVTNR
jgi:predicted DNA-binding protein